MGFLKSTFLSFFLVCLSFVASAADDVVLDKQITLAVDQLLKRPNGATISVVKTQELRTEAGELLRGVHDVLFTLDPSSAFPVNVNDQIVSPGQTVSFTTNLTQSSHRLYFPIYPANAGEYGDTTYKIHLPSLSATDCPVGSLVMQNKGCEITELHAGLYTCPDSYILNAITCELNEVIKINSACPVGMSLVDGECETSDVVNTSDSCTDGYVNDLVNGNCTQTILYPMQYTCPVNYELQSDTTCKQDETILPSSTCPVGYMLIDEQCEKMLEYAITNCETGYVLSNGECYEQQLTSIVCPTNYVFINNQCEFTESINPSPTCNVGYVLNAAEQCIKRIEVPVNGHSCPEGTLWTNTGCERIERFTQIETCPVDYYFNGKYCQKESEAAFLGCESGWIFKDGECFEEHDFSLKCPSGYTLDKNACVKTDVIPNTQGCPTGYAFNGSTNLCSKTIVIGAAESCLEGYSVINNVCQKNITAPITSCDSGFEEKNGRCYKVLAITKTCPTGYTNNSGTCEYVDTVAKSERCPDTYVLNGNNDCERTLEVDAYQSCTTDGFNIVNGVCEKVIEAEFSTCLSGYDLVNGECYLVTDKQDFCPDGYRLSADESICEKTAIVESTQVCPDEWENLGTHCEWRHSYAAEATCPSGYLLNNARCEQFVTEKVNECQPNQINHDNDTCGIYNYVSPSCPPGTTFNNDACYVENTVAKNRCEDGFIYSSGSCYEVVNKEQTCPNGMILDEIAGQPSCKEVVSILSCPNGFSDNGSGKCAKDGLLATEKDYCPDGATWVSTGAGWGQCQISENNITLSETIQYCPDGYNKVSQESCFNTCPKDSQMNGEGTCDSIDLVKTSQKACLTGTMVNGTCWTILGSEKGETGYQCEIGYENTEHPTNLDINVSLGYSNICSKVETSNAINYCASDFGVKGDLCARDIVLKSKDCQTGSSLGTDGQCHLINTKEVQCNSFPASVSGAEIKTRTFDKATQRCLITYEYEHHSDYICPVGFSQVHPFTSSFTGDSIYNENAQVFIGQNDELWTAFTTNGNGEVMLGPRKESQAISTSENIENYLCVSDTIRYNHIYLGDEYDQTFLNVTDGSVNYLNDRSKNFLTDIQDRLIGRYDNNGNFNAEYLGRTNTNVSDKNNLQVFMPTLSTDSAITKNTTIPGWTELNEATKAFTIVGHEDYVMYGVRLVAGKLPNYPNVDPKSYIKVAEAAGAIDLVESCNNSTADMITNLRLYNNNVYQGLTSNNKTIRSFSGYADPNTTEEKCLVEVAVNITETYSCPLGYKTLTNGLCQKEEAIKQAEICQGVSAQSHTRSCQSGMVLSSDGLMCEKTTLVDALIDCGSGTYNKESGMCLMGSECPSDYARDGDYCTTSFSCKEYMGETSAYYFEDQDSCVYSTYNAEKGANEQVFTPVTCPNAKDSFNATSMECKHLELDGEKAPTYFCPEGELSGTQCQIKVTEIAQDIRHWGIQTYNQAQGQCTEKSFTESAFNEHYCDKGETPSIINGSAYCVTQAFQDTVIDLAICPQGFIADKVLLGKCSKSAWHPIVEEYEIGTVLIEDWQVKSIADNAKLKCPLGSISSGETCTSLDQSDINPFQQSCAGKLVNHSDNDTINNIVCETQIIQPVCENGWILGTNPFACQRIEINVPINICKPTYTLNGEHCETVYSEPIDFQCPENFLLSPDNKECSEYITKPKSEPCDIGSVHKDAQTCISLVEDNTMGQCLPGYEYDITTDKCRNVTQEAVIYSCDLDRALNPPKCDKVETKPTIYTCPSNYVDLGNGNCEYRVTAPKVNSCIDGFDPSGDSCIQNTNTGSAGNCASGYLLDSNGDFCSKNVTGNTIWSCEDGYDLKNTNECHRNEILLAQYTCTGINQLSEDETCENTSVTTAQVICPSDHAWDNSLNICKKVNTETFSGCQSGYVFSDGICKLLEAKNYDCPAGFVLNGIGQCLSTATKSPNTVCPTGYTNNNGTCVKEQTTTGSKSCPSPYYLSAGVCKKTLTSTVSSCPSGYSLQGGTCRSITNKLYSCASGYTLSGTTCYKNLSTSATRSCPAGYGFNSSTSKCEKHDSRNATQSCPTGYTNTGTICSKTTTSSIYPSISTAEYCYCSQEHIDERRECRTEGYTWTCSTRELYSCPIGYAFNPTIAKCERSTTSTAAISYSCPTGYTLSGTTCNRTLRVEETYSCSSGYTLSGTTCRKTVQQAATAYCPSGYSSLNSTQCFKNLPTNGVGSCPSGYSISGTVCYSYPTHSNTLSCDNGYYYASNSCYKIYSKTLTCPSGYSLVGQQCELNQTKSITETCPSGYLLYDGLCSMTVNVGFSACSSGYTLSSHGGYKACYKTTSKQTVCASGWTVEGEECRKMDSFNASYICPEGYNSTSSNSCNRFEYYPQYIGCPASHPTEYLFNRSQCTNGTSQVDKSLQCKSGTSFDSSLGKCKKEIIKGKFYQCPTSHDLSGNICQKMLKQHPEKVISSPIGFEPEYRSTPQSVSIVADNTKGICPSGYSKGDDLCEKTYTHPSTDVCDTGYDLVAGQCLQKLIVNSSLACPISGINIDNKYCRTASNTSSALNPFYYNCSSGYAAKGESCYRLLTSSANKTCDSGYTHNQSTCANETIEPTIATCNIGSTSYNSALCNINSDTAGAHVCPSKYLDIDGVCRDSTLSLASYTCPTGNLVGYECKTLMSQPADFKCPEEYTLSNSSCIKIESEAITKECRDGFASLNWQFCYRNTPNSGVSTCPSGYKISFEERRCVKVTETERITTCPVSHTLNARNGLCETTTEVSDDPFLLWVCPTGYEYDSQRASCFTLQEATSGSGWSCPAGYSLNKNACQKIITNTSTTTCPPTTSFIGGVCRYTAKDRTTSSGITCPSGFGYNSNIKLCTSDIAMAPQKNCSSAGYIFNALTNLCESPLIFQDPVRTCPAGYIDNVDFEACVKEVLIAAVPICNSGFVYHQAQNKCVDEDDHDPIITCPAGYGLTADNKNCEKLLVVSNGTQCETGFTAINGTTCRSTTPTDSKAICPTGFYIDPVKNICEKEEVIPLIYACPTGYVFDNDKKACRIINVIAGLELCPEGFELTTDKSQCFKTELSPSTVECPEGYHNREDGTCSLTIKIPPTTTCPMNYSLSSNGTCERLEQHEALIECPLGMTYNGSECHQLISETPTRCQTGYKLINGACYLFDNADYKCPSGYSIVREEGVLSCKWKVLSISTISCLIGTYNVERNTCINTETLEDYGSQNIYCQSTNDKTKKPIPGDYLDNYKRCEHLSLYDAQEYRISCPGDFIEHGDDYCRAIVADSDKVRCATGFTYNKNSLYCETVELQTPTLKCYDAFFLDGEVCKKSVFVDVTVGECPADFTEIGLNECMRIEEIPATMICPIGFVQISHTECSKTTYLPPF